MQWLFFLLGSLRAPRLVEGLGQQAATCSHTQSHSSCCFEPVLLTTRRSFLIAGAASTVMLTPVAGFAADPETSSATSSSAAPFQPGRGSARYEPVVVGDWDASSFPAVTTQLGQSRIFAAELSPLPQNNNPFADPELYYAPFLFGAWNVTATLRRKTYPYGTDVLPLRSLVDGSPWYRDEQVGETRSYEAHYFATLANTLQNQMTVNLGLGVPATKIIADRAFNVVSVSKAYPHHQRTPPVQYVMWDYRDNPTRVLLEYYDSGSLTDESQPLAGGFRTAEIVLTGRQSETVDDDDNPTFAAAERTVTVAPGTVVVSDTETATEFHKVSDDFVTAVSRTAVYLSPNSNSHEDMLWQQVGGKAVVFLDYELTMQRNKENFTDAHNGIISARPCVKTPNDVVQCY